MPLWARSLILITPLFVLGCAQWPTPEHRAVTLESIDHLINEHEDNSQKAMSEQLEALECRKIGDVSLLLDQQSEQLAAVNKQLVVLAAATPSFVSSSCTPVAATVQYDGRAIVGALEWVYFPIASHHYQARIDSGATTSSIHANNIVRFERDGKKWVKFELREDDDSEPIEIETPLTRMVLIRQASAGGTERRPVVTLTVNLGGLQQNSEFTLTNRSKMTYPVLLGRNFLQDVTLIDVGRDMIQPKFLPKAVPAPAVKDPERAPKKKPSVETPAQSQTTENKAKKNSVDNQPEPVIDDTPVKRGNPEQTRPD